MKKALLPLLLLVFLTSQLHAVIILPYAQQTQYRWRNDDGNETTATWKAAANTPIQVSNTTDIIRLRIEMNNTSGSDHMVNEMLEYSSDGGVVWTTMTNSPTNAFHYVNSTQVTNGTATTNQLGTATFGTFSPGNVISATPGATMLTLLADGRTEYEWVIKPTANTLQMATYIFRSVDQGTTPLVYPTLNTTCLGAISNSTGASRCGPGTVSLNATGTAGTTVKWFSAPTGGTELASGTTFTTPLLTNTTVFYASATFGTCESPRVPVVATVNPIPTPNLGNDKYVCENDPATFDAGLFSGYLWDNGATTQTRTVTVPGTYYVTVTGFGGCQAADTIKLLNHPRPLVNLGTDTLICPGVTLTLDAGNPGMTYLWDNGTTEQTREVFQTGTYSVEVRNEFNCPASDEILLTVKDVPLGNINAVYGKPGTYAFSVPDAQYSIGAIWDFGDGSPTVMADEVEHTYAANGIYTVRLELLGDCDSNMTQERTVDVFDAGGTSVQDISKPGSVNIYPNPAEAYLQIENKSGIAFQSVEVYNIVGQRVMAHTKNIAEGTILDTGHLSPGIYALRIHTATGIISRTFEIKK
jgi:hypothetical protein